MRNNNSNQTKIMVVFFIVAACAFLSIATAFVRFVIQPKDYNDSLRLNLSIWGNYLSNYAYKNDTEGFPLFMLYIFSNGLTILPILGGLIGSSSGRKPVTRISIIVLDLVCGMVLLSRVTGVGVDTKYYDGIKLDPDTAIIMVCVLILNIYIFGDKSTTQSYASTNANRWICRNCGAENGLSNTCITCGSNRYAEPKIVYAQPVPQAPVQAPPAQTNVSGDASKFEDVKAYKEMLDSGIITQEEFDKKKAEILGL